MKYIHCTKKLKLFAAAKTAMLELAKPVKKWNTVGVKKKFRIPFRRTAVAQLKTGKKQYAVCWKMAVPLDRITVLIYLVHRMSRSKKYKKSFIQ